MVSKNNVREMKSVTALKKVAQQRGIKGYTKYKKASMNNLRRKILNNMNNNRGMGGLVKRHPSNAPKNVPVWVLPKKKTADNAKRQILTSYLRMTNTLRRQMNNYGNFKSMYNTNLNNIKNNNKRILYFTEYHNENMRGVGGMPSIILKNSGVPNFRGNMNNTRGIIKVAMNHGLIGKNFRVTSKGEEYLRSAY
jgi:hypothetical protein